MTSLGYSSKFSSLFAMFLYLGVSGVLSLQFSIVSHPPPRLSLSLSIIIVLFDKMKLKWLFFFFFDKLKFQWFFLIIVRFFFNINSLVLEHPWQRGHVSPLIFLIITLASLCINSIFHFLLYKITLAHTLNQLRPPNICSLCKRDPSY